VSDEATARLMISTMGRHYRSDHGIEQWISPPLLGPTVGGRSHHRCSGRRKYIYYYQHYKDFDKQLASHRPLRPAMKR